MAKKRKDKLFVCTAKTILASIPCYQQDKDKLEIRFNEAIKFRNELILQMSGGANHAFVARMGSDTVASNMYKTACNIALATLLEELPESNTITSIKEVFEEDSSIIEEE
jgi:hypothetical protein